ncbi:MAG: GNAT family N-acetyltransferase [Candidatus Hermodarchaeota archaeon]
MSKFLLSSIEQNLDSFYLKCSSHPNFESMDSDEIKWVLAKNADWPSCIFHVNFSSSDLDSEIERVKSLILTGKAPDGWTVGPLTKPKNLGKSLLEHGFLNVFQQTGMALNLSKLDTSAKINITLDVERVEDREELSKWSNVVSTVFHIKIDDDLLEYLHAQSEAKFYIGIYNKRAVSALLLYLIPKVAGLHAVSTLPEYRKQNFAVTMSNRALVDAREMGFKYGVLQASSMGQFVYKKLGFKKYCDIITYALNEE